MENEIESGLRLFFWITTVIMLICVLGVVLLMLIYRNKMHNLYRKESETLLKVTLNIEKRERQRLASELHDSISGDLTAVQNFITILYRKEGDEFKKSIFSEVESTVSKVLSDIENVTFDLMPPMLEINPELSNIGGISARVTFSISERTLLTVDSTSLNILFLNSSLSFQYRTLLRFYIEKRVTNLKKVYLVKWNLR